MATAACSTETNIDLSSSLHESLLSSNSHVLRHSYIDAGVVLLMPTRCLTQCREDGIGEFKQCRLIFDGQDDIVHQRQDIFNALPE
jgi:hypothetical protein